MNDGCEDAAIESENGSDVEKADGVRVLVVAEEVMMSCASPLRCVVCPSSCKAPYRESEEHTPEHPECQPEGGELVQATDMV